MAEDKNHDQDPEEEKNDHLDDDDFGLPDLEYDELDDDDFEDEIEAPVEDEAEAAEDTSDPVEEVDEVESSDDDIEVDEDIDIDIDDIDLDSIDTEDIDTSELDETDLEDIDTSDLDDVDVDDIEISDEELQAELAEMDEGEITSSSSDSEFYEEESFEEFEEKDDVISSVFGADEGTSSSEGGQEILGKDFKDKLVSGPSAGSSFTPSGNTGARRNFGKIVILGTIVITIIGVVFYLVFASGGPKKEAAVEKPVEKPVVVEQQPEPEPEPEPEPDPTPSKPPAGTITTLDARNGKSYVVIGSFVDGDLAMDHATALSEEGKSPYIIPPFANHIFYRVAIAEFDDFAAANNSLGNYRGDYGDDIWTLRY